MWEREPLVAAMIITWSLEATPKLAVVEVGYLTNGTFAERLERAIGRSDRAKLIEGRAEPIDRPIVFGFVFSSSLRFRLSVVLPRAFPAQPSNEEDEAQHSQNTPSNRFFDAHDTHAPRSSSIRTQNYDDVSGNGLTSPRLARREGAPKWVPRHATVANDP
jgi:hypothetical protein